MSKLPEASGVSHPLLFNQGWWCVSSASTVASGAARFPEVAGNRTGESSRPGRPRHSSPCGGEWIVRSKIPGSSRIIHFYPEKIYLAVAWNGRGRTRKFTAAYETALAWLPASAVASSFDGIVPKPLTPKSQSAPAGFTRLCRQPMYRARTPILPEEPPERLKHVEELRHGGLWFAALRHKPHNADATGRRELGALTGRPACRRSAITSGAGILNWRGKMPISHGSSWLTQAEGKAVVVVHLLLPHLPLNRDYRVILMQRDLIEVIALQRACSSSRTTHRCDARIPGWLRYLPSSWIEVRWWP